VRPLPCKARSRIGWGVLKICGRHQSNLAELIDDGSLQTSPRTNRATPLSLEEIDDGSKLGGFSVRSPLLAKEKRSSSSFIAGFRRDGQVEDGARTQHPRSPRALIQAQVRHFINEGLSLIRLQAGRDG